MNDLSCKHSSQLAEIVQYIHVDSKLSSMQEQGVGILFTSLKWFFQQPTPDTFNFRVLDYLVQTACSQGLQLSVVLDAQANPPWVFDVVPDAGVVDSKYIGHRSISFNHPAVMQLVHAWYDAVLARMAELNATCIHSVQPCFNNEYETKYIQVTARSLCCGRQAVAHAQISVACGVLWRNPEHGSA